MATDMTAVVSPRMHRRIDQLTFPGLLATAAWMSRWDRKAAAVTLVTAAVEGVAHVTTDYPPAILPWMSFRTHNRLATAHGAAVIALALLVPGISRRGRWALCALGTMPITLAALSDTRGSRREGDDLDRVVPRRGDPHPVGPSDHDDRAEIARLPLPVGGQPRVLRPR